MIPSIVLNLDRCPERLSWFFEQANKIGLYVKKVSATDVNNPKIRHYIDKIISDGSPLSKSEIACLMTHRDVWQGLLNSDQEAIAIFEDDACLGFDLITLLDQELPNINFDLIRLETYLTRVSLSRKIYSTIGKVQLRKLLTTAYGSAAYVISKRSARYFLEYTDKFQHPVDLALFGITSLKLNKICVLQAVPAVCVQQDRINPPLFKSDIQITKNKVKKPIYIKLFIEFIRLFKSIHNYCCCVYNGANPFYYKYVVSVLLNDKYDSD